MFGVTVNKLCTEKGGANVQLRASIQQPLFVFYDKYREIWRHLMDKKLSAVSGPSNWFEAFDLVFHTTQTSTQY